jgi:ATP-dependent DNA ligase
MECVAVSKLHDGPQWIYEIKLDGYRALGIKSDRGVRLLSRRNNPFNRQYGLCFVPWFLVARQHQQLSGPIAGAVGAELVGVLQRR